MSSPRAATSVATSTRSCQALKWVSPRVRWLWFLLPWMASAVMPSRSSCSARRLAPCLVRENTRTWRQSPLVIRCANNARLRSLSTGCTTCEMRFDVASTLSTATSTGACRKESASPRISFENVAEKNRFCLFAGSEDDRVGAQRGELLIDGGAAVLGRGGQV